MQSLEHLRLIYRMTVASTNDIVTETQSPEERYKYTTILKCSDLSNEVSFDLHSIQIETDSCLSFGKGSLSKVGIEWSDFESTQIGISSAHQVSSGVSVWVRLTNALSKTYGQLFEERDIDEETSEEEEHWNRTDKRTVKKETFEKIKKSENV